MRVRYTQEGATPSRAKLELDGYDASHATRGFRVRSSVNDLTTVELDLVVLHGADLDADAMVLIPAATVDLLVAHGWTPPEGAEVRGGAMRLERQAIKEPDLLDGLCVCADDPDAPESCPVHGRVHKRS